MGAHRPGAHALARRTAIVLKPRAAPGAASERSGCLYDRRPSGRPAVVVPGCAPARSAEPCSAVFSAETEDGCTAHPALPRRISAQLSVDWSTSRTRKMTTRVTLYGAPRTDLRRPPGVPMYPARHRHLPSRLRARLERRYHRRLTDGLVLYSGWGTAGSTSSTAWQGAADGLNDCRRWRSPTVLDDDPGRGDSRSPPRGRDPAPAPTSSRTSTGQLTALLRRALEGVRRLATRARNARQRQEMRK